MLLSNQSIFPEKEWKTLTFSGNLWNPWTKKYFSGLFLIPYMWEILGRLGSHGVVIKETKVKNDKACPAVCSWTRSFWRNFSFRSVSFGSVRVSKVQGLYFMILKAFSWVTLRFWAEIIEPVCLEMEHLRLMWLINHSGQYRLSIWKVTLLWTFVGTFFGTVIHKVMEALGLLYLQMSK